MTLGNAASRNVFSGLRDESKSGVHLPKIGGHHIYETADSHSGLVALSNDTLPARHLIVDQAAESHTEHEPSDHSRRFLDGSEGDVHGKGKDGETQKGKTLIESTFSRPPFSTMNDSSLRAKRSATSIESTPFKKRAISRSSTLFENPNDPRAVLDDNPLEPCPHDPICDSVSEILNGCSNTMVHNRDDVQSALKTSFGITGQSSHTQAPFRMRTKLDNRQHLLSIFTSQHSSADVDDGHLGRLADGSSASVCSYGQQYSEDDPPPFETNVSLAGMPTSSLNALLLDLR